jgi:hypothetical protein
VHYRRIGAELYKETDRRRLEGDRDCCHWDGRIKCGKPAARVDYLCPEALQRNVGSRKPTAQFVQGRGPHKRGKIAAYDSFVANSGTYEVAGATLTLHPMVARSPNFMAGGVSKFQLRIEGTTLWLTQKNTDLSLLTGDRVAPSSGPASETRLKLSRVE